MGQDGTLLGWRGALKLQQLGRFAEADAAWRQALAASPRDPALWAGLVGCLLLDRRPEAALDVCANGLRLLPGASQIHCAKARVLQSVSRVAEAAAAYRAALELDPNAAEARFGLALQALEAGEWDTAAALAPPLGSGADAGPEIDWLHARVALGSGDPETALSRASRALAAAGLTRDQQAEIALLKGEALDELGRWSEAFAAFAQGKGLLHSLYAARAGASEGETAKMQRLASWFEATDAAVWRAAATPDVASPAREHVFLVGFPRSGTTLLEQAMAGHPDLVALEEAPTLADAFDELMITPEGLARLRSLPATESDRWRQRYWRVVRERGCEPAGRVFLDKAPAGTIYLPLIARLFPRAKILFAIRDPRDVALSCFRNSFQMNALTYAFTDLGETARCYAASMRMAAAYRRTLPLDVAEVRYETLVEDFAGELARICRFVGLQASPAMADVAATARRRSVRTPSASQVRAGLNRSGLGRWRAYQPQMASVLPVLAPWIEALGYGASG